MNFRIETDTMGEMKVPLISIMVNLATEIINEF